MTQVHVFARIGNGVHQLISLPRGYGHAKYRIIGADSATWRASRNALKLYFRLDECGRATISEIAAADCLMLVVERVGGFDGPVPPFETFAFVMAELFPLHRPDAPDIREGR
jgi:hypothetical protein